MRSTVSATPGSSPICSKIASASSWYGKPLLRLLEIHVPVANTIQAARNERPVAESARHGQRLAPIVAGTRIVARRPQHTQRVQRFPFGAKVGCSARAVERGGEVVVGTLEISERLVRPAAREIEIDGDLHSGPLGRHERAIEMGDGFARRGQLEGVPARAGRIGCRARPISRLPRVVGERFDDGVQCTPGSVVRARRRFRGAGRPVLAPAARRRWPRA